MNTTFIYVLNDPITGLTRYVGKAKHPEKRLRGHLSAPEKCRRTNWIRSLKEKNLIPILHIVDEVPDIEWPMWEVAYIQFFRDEGNDLVNGTAGGEGGHNPPPEVRAKQRLAKLGKRSPRKGVRLSLEIRNKISAALMGQQFSAARCKKMLELANRRWASYRKEKLCRE